jgi:hypothetical protein
LELIAMRFYTTSDLGPQRSLTPDGFLLCRDAVLARCGVQHYGPGETPIAGDFVRIERDPEEVFSDEAVASANGKPVVNDHPMDAWGGRIDVSPDNWRDFAVGHVMSPRRSADDFLVADLMITERRAIDLINHGKRQLSCGYDADYEDIAPGHGRQRNIRINHVALVDQARCGPLCSIGDSLAPGTEQGLLCGHVPETKRPAIVLHLPRGGLSLAAVADLARWMPNRTRPAGRAL